MRSKEIRIGLVSTIQRHGRWAALLAALALLPAIGGRPRLEPRPAAAQPALCPPVTLHLPLLMRARGVPPDPLHVAPPRPELHGPCPTQTPGTPTPGTETPGTLTPGTETPGTPTPGTETPGTPTPGTPTPGTETPGTETPGTLTPGTLTPGTLTPTAGATGTATGAPTSGPSPSPTTSPTPTLTPTATRTPTPTLPPGVFGAQVFESDLGPIYEGQVDEMGATWVRTRALWAGIEPTDASPRVYRWGSLDNMIDTIAGRHLRPVVVVYTKPAWAASESCGPIDKVPLARYGEFLQALVERYDGDGIDDAPGSPVARHWEIGNEPDLMDSQRGDEDFGSCFGDDPAAYGEQLRVAWQAIKAADPLATVLFGSVAYERFYDSPPFDPPGPFRYDFVREVLSSLHESHADAPGFPFFDWMGFHNYNDYRNNWDDAEDRTPEIIGKAAHLRGRQLIWPGKFDLSAMPLFATEVGLPSGPSDAWTERSEDLQAAYLGQVMVRSMAAGLEGAIWYSLSDTLADTSTPSTHCDDLYFWLTHGLLRTRWVAAAAASCPDNPLPGYATGEDFEAKPAQLAFQVAARLFSGAELDRRLSDAETGDADIEAWRLRLFDQRMALVAFGDTGERIGRRGVPPPSSFISVSADILPGWTGRLRITEHLGASRIEEGATVLVPVGQAPVYLEVLP